MNPKTTATRPIEKVAVHERPDLDEILGLWLLKKFGQSLFPGIEKAEIIFWGLGEVANFNEAEWPNTKFIGVPRSKLDEHPTSDSVRKKDECAATLIFQELMRAHCIDDLSAEALQRLLAFTKDEDINAGRGEYELPSLVKTRHQSNPEDPQGVIERTLADITDIYKRQYDFLSKVREEFVMKTERNVVCLREGYEVNVGWIRSDQEDLDKASRMKSNGDFAVFIQFRSSGNWQITTNIRHGVRLNEVVRVLRYEEQKKRYGKQGVVTWNWDDLEREGTVEGCLNIYYQPKGEMILNGSKKHPNVEPTVLTLEEIVKIVLETLDYKSFEPSRCAKCLQGKCTSTRVTPCEWFERGLRRCRKLQQFRKEVRKIWR
ncbi:hypothetical protein IT397_01165 [Candidatus Nomurabacteria bacterium]|nr:hypothetical protein [Candidatus Nomurabacteria bacterium]